MKIETWALSKIKPYKNNPRKNDGAVPAVAESIKQCGYCAPIIVDEDGVILAGHTRLKALKKLGWKEAEVVIRDGLTEEQKKKYRLLDNKTGETAEWDFDILNTELEGMDFEGFDFGFEIPGAEPGEVIEDEFDETLPEEPVTKLGDIWQLGRHRLMCGDSTDAGTIALLMDGKKADMVFTDPPYNIASDSMNFAHDVSKSMNDLKNAEWDKNFHPEAFIENLPIFIKDDCTIYIFTSHFLFQRVLESISAFTDFQSYCVWCKPNPMPSLSKRHWTWNTELCIYATKGKHIFNFPKEGHALSSWIINKKSDGSHPTQKPIELLQNPIIYNTKEGGTVLDLFGGSGSTLIACEQLNRTCYMMELDPKYCDVIVRRWETLTGQTAVKA